MSAYRLEQDAKLYAVLDRRTGQFVRKYDGGFTYHTKGHASARVNQMNKVWIKRYKDETETTEPYVVVVSTPEWSEVD